MVRKNYILKEKSCEILREVMKEKGLKTETAALEYVLNEYSENFIKKSFEKMSADIAELKQQLENMASVEKFVANNSEIMMDCMNTLMTERGYAVCYPADEEPSEVIKKAEEYRKKRADKNKQIKENRRL